MIDNLVNPNKSELPKVPVEKTLKKFYQPKLNLMKSVTKKPHKPKSPGLEIYSKSLIFNLIIKKKIFKKIFLI